MAVMDIGPELRGKGRGGCPGRHPRTLIAPVVDPVLLGNGRIEGLYNAEQTDERGVLKLRVSKREAGLVEQGIAADGGR
jgi:hypothetical protein